MATYISLTNGQTFFLCDGFSSQDLALRGFHSIAALCVAAVHPLMTRIFFPLRAFACIVHPSLLRAWAIPPVCKTGTPYTSQPVLSIAVSVSFRRTLTIVADILTLH